MKSLKPDSIFDNEILPTGYSIYCNDRGGGAMLAVKNTISSSVMSSLPGLEGLSVTIR